LKGENVLEMRVEEGSGSVLLVTEKEVWVIRMD
jgi:hypothetical protein